MFLAFFFYFTMLQDAAGSCNGKAYYLSALWLPAIIAGWNLARVRCRWIGQKDSRGPNKIIINNPLAFSCNKAHLTGVR